MEPIDREKRTEENIMSNTNTTDADASPDYDAIIIGAGFSGLYALHKLRNELGLNVRVFEAASGVGGTWWYNRYPGARVDGPSAPHYGYLFSKELAEEWDWSETQTAGPEILDYLGHFTKRFDLLKDITFDTWVTGAKYDAQNQRWMIKTDGGETVSAQFLVCATGVLFVANMPDYPGIEDFSGDTYHTGRWPHEEVDFKGKRVGVIGTGSSGIQVIPEIAKTAEHVTVFQRTAQYSLPARNRAITKEEMSAARAEWTNTRDLMNKYGGFPFVPKGRRSSDFTPEERRAVYEEHWERGGLGLSLDSFRGVLAKRDLNEEIGDFVRDKIKQIVKDPETAEKLLPRYLFGTKRLILDNGYYEVFNQDNVSLVSIKEDPITSFTSSSVITNSGEHPIDILVLATGFDAVTGSMLKLNPVGIDGVRLEEKWKDRFENFMGVTVPGYPNMFTIQGPGSPGAFFTIPLGSEHFGDWICNCIAHMRKHKLGSVAPSEQAALDWGESVDALANRTLYPNTDSWYTGSNIPGKGRQFLGYINGSDYYARLADQAEKGFPDLEFEPQTNLQNA